MKELWIRSQDGEVLGKAKEIMIYQKEKQCEIIINNYTYGTYATKERALEVLDEIQNILKPQEYEIEKGDGYYTKSTNISTYVYEMPKK